MCQTVVELQEQTEEEAFSDREMKTQRGVQRVLSSSRGDKEKYLLALNEAIALGRRSAEAEDNREESSASDRRCVKFMLVKRAAPVDPNQERPVMCHKEHDDDVSEVSVHVQEKSVSTEDHQDEHSVVFSKEVEEVKQDEHRSCVSTVPLVLEVCACVCLRVCLCLCLCLCVSQQL